jgi:hypothetical protein
VTAERIGRNDATFREANQPIHASALEYQIGDSFPIICECADARCTAVLKVSFAEYKAVREHPSQFFHSPGHDDDPRRRARSSTRTTTGSSWRRRGRPRRNSTREQFGSSVSDREVAIDDRQRRVVKNETLFRAVNEQLEGLNEAFATFSDAVTIVCECGDGTCVDQIDVSLDEYESVRADAALFFVKRGHEDDEVEDVVSDASVYLVVRKRAGEPQELAEELDTRNG